MAAFTPWVERYRPRDVGSLSHQEEVVGSLERAVQAREVSHLLFYGPPGTGKTTAAWAVARQLFGNTPEMLRERVLELNASDERGINAVIPKVKAFSSAAVSSRKLWDETTQRDIVVPPYKLVILDEADAMTPWAQTALRRVIENHVKTTRFVLICNYVSRIIDPLVSRCAKHRFKSIPSEAMQERLEAICAQERVRWFPAVGLRIASIASGDMRRAITLLQTLAAFFGDAVAVDGKSPSATLESELLAAADDIAGVIPDPVIQRLIDATAKGNFAAVQAAVLETTQEGYAANTVLSALFDALVVGGDAAGEKGEGAGGKAESGASSSAAAAAAAAAAAGSAASTSAAPHCAAMSDAERARVALALAESDAALVDGADETLQLMSSLSAWPR